ncbi:calcium permeable stress-gated cation channel 1-like isoform X2 [Homarus americanus]|uniref:CSC1-like protein 2-like n=1 Tax=Homarus americanus TaxID=6706 RepID=A0A8J5MPZ6_HOMAM|nr:calcium permeable stress-gated cation channel 1-like isoform X2 [Homarus americanus]KAG7159503.1 CSC1-like protein 2-like [Homarus americanus]
MDATVPMSYPTVYAPMGTDDLDDLQDTTVYASSDDLDDLQEAVDKKACNQYVIQNKTHLFYGGYEGIPENLLINFLGWILLLILFTVLRKKAWNYGRLALVQKYESRWTQIFYGKETDMGKVAGEADSVSSLEFNMHIDKGLFSWILALFKIKDEQILTKSGRDAISYLSFQRHIIVYMMIVCVISIVIVLPINFQGTLAGDEKEFGHTTLANLSPRSRLMWVHVTLAFLFLPLGILFTRRFSKKLELREVTTSVSRTLMITRVPRRSCHKDTILKHFQEAYPEIEVHDVQFAYDIRSLIAYDKEREVALNAKLFCEAYLKETNRRLDMRPYRCGVICGCCDIFGCPTVDAIEYYAEEEARLSNHVENEKVKAMQRPTGVAYVTFDSIENAKKVMLDHKTKCDCLKIPPTSSVSVELKPHNWIIRVAPAPEDIYWGNLSVTNRHWWLKAVLLNLILFVVLFFLTTPFVLINVLDIIPLSGKLHNLSPVLSEFFPTLFIWIIAALMPVIVSYSDQFMSHWTRSSENHSIMRKTFIFLLFMVIILPSLGLTSIKGLAESLFRQSSNNETIRWECIFLPDNGAFFVNYVITSAFIGTSLELIRFPELFMYIMRLTLTRSEAETASVRRAILYEFPFGVQYAWMLLNFALTIIYSVSCPLITPFGTLYMVFKHLVDKYNIYFAYGPSRINKNIHTSAINFVIVSIVCLQLSLLFLSLIRQGLKKDITIYSIILLIITCLVFITHNAFHWFKDLSPVEYKKFGNGHANGDTASVSDDGNDEEITTAEVACKFVPPVLRDAPSGVETSYSYIQPRSYGTRPLEEDGFTVDGGPLSTLEGSPITRERQPAELYQDYSHPKVTTVSAEINIPPASQPPTEEEEEDTVYTRASPRQPSPTVVAVDGSVATGSSPTTIHSNQRHSHSGLDNNAPATNV